MQSLVNMQGAFVNNIIVPPSPKIVVKKANPNGHWEFPEEMGKGKACGFVYAVVDPYLGRAYLGKKLYRGTGKLNAGKESNWRSYVSSSATMAQLFQERPKEEFQFVCLEEYVMKGALSYAETWSLCLVEAPTSKNWYNTRIEAISWPVKEGITERHKQRLNNIIEQIGSV
jgi:hypothetical protein